MPKYKITASKSQKKYNFVLSAENEKLAKQRVHKDGYSILTVELFDENNITRGSFIFEAEKAGEIKKWKVVWDDIFKIYLKLKDGMGYNIIKLYSDLDIKKADDYKKNILLELEEQYKYFKNTKKEKLRESEESGKNKVVDKNEINVDNFYLKKELEETYKLIDFVLNKLNKLLAENKYNLNDLKKEKLKNLYNSLIKIKSSTNTTKLKEVWEAILLKIWEIELEYLEKSKDEKGKVFLSETNNLLKQIWSEKKFVPENRDLWKQFEKFLNLVVKFFDDFKKEKKEKHNNSLKLSDKNSHDYLRTIIFLNKYKQKLKQNNLEILKNIFVYIFPTEKNNIKKQDLTVRRKVIKQNIFLFKAKLEWKVFSYTKVIKWFDHILEITFNFFNYIRDYLFYVVFFYSLLFLLFVNLNFYNVFPIFEGSLNYNWIFYFIIFLFIYFAIYFSRWIYSLFFNFIILFLIILFGIINF